MPPPGSPSHHTAHEAYAAWQWWNYLETQVPADKRSLRINLDETCISLFQGGRPGAVFCSKKRHRSEPIEAASLAKRRTCMTHVALICDDPVVQAVLPQFLLGNERTLPIRELAALRASCPPNVHIVRQKSAWNSHLVCARIVRTLRAALEPHMGGYQPVLPLDTVKFHYGQTVLAACRRAGIWVILVPPKINVAATAAGHECVSPFQGCACTGVSEGTRKHGRWPNFTQRFHPVHLHSNPHNLTRSSGAFDGNGFGRQQAQLSSLVVHHFQLGSAVGCMLLRPTMDRL